MTLPDNRDQCHKRVTASGQFHSHQCTRKSKNWEQGFFWCKQHTPSLHSAKVKAANADYIARSERTADIIRTRNALLIAICNAESDNLPLCIRNAVDRYRKARS